MVKQSVLGVFVLCLFIRSTPAQSLQTPGEACGYSRYTQHNDIDQFLSALLHQSRNVVVQEAGKTKAVENMPATGLPLCILNAERAQHPEQFDRRKPTIFIIASQHGNEQSAKEAALVLIRDLAMGDLQWMLNRANFLIMPQANPYGNWFDQRSNEIELDMNRDHVKLETEGAQAIHRVFRTWMPEVTLDVHERGDNYYQIAQGCVSNLNVSPEIQDYSRTVILTSVKNALAKEKIPFHEYTVTSENMPGDASGADFSAADLSGRPTITRYSTSDLNDCRNSLGIFQTFSFIQEASSRHDVQTLARRTDRQVRAIRAFLQTVVEHGQEIKTKVADRRRPVLDQPELVSPSEQIHLKMEYRRDDQQSELSVMAFQPTDSPVVGVLKVDKRAGDVVVETEMQPAAMPAKQKVISTIEKNWFPLVVSTCSVTRPLGYIIPDGHPDVIATLRLHGIAVHTFTQDFKMQVEGYLVKKIVPAKYDFLAPETLAVERQIFPILCKKGDFFIFGRQPAGNLVACLLEPESDYGLIRYWRYHLVPQAEEYFAFFRVVIEQNPPLVQFKDW